jgi:hypothetical protein
MVEQQIKIQGIQWNLLRFLKLETVKKITFAPWQKILAEQN